MKFNKFIEDFNIFPNSQNAVQLGPDAGNTTGDFDDTFPNRKNTIAGNLLPNIDVQITINKAYAKRIYKLLSSVLKN